MNEKDIEEPLEYSTLNNQKDQKEYFNLNKKNIDSDSLFTIVIHFPNKRTFSFEVPQIWTTKKLISFIKSTFNPEFKKSTSNFIYHGNLLSPFSESPLKDYFKLDKINHIVITLKNINQENNNENIQNNLNLKTNTEVFKSDEFIKLENSYMDDYFKIFKNNAINNFPIMNPSYNHRREQIKNNSILEKLEELEPIPLEDFPFRNYFQLNIIFKCFISFFAFGIYIKGFNFILFLSVLIGYYAYCINNVIDEFYKKKIQEIGISEEDYKRIKNGGINILKHFKDRNKNGIFIFDNEDDEEDKKEEKKEKENEESNENISNKNKNINKDSNNIKTDINIGEDVKDYKENKEEENNNENKFYFNLGKENNINNLIFNKEEIKNEDDKNGKKDDVNNDKKESPLLNDILTGNNLREQNNNYINNENNLFNGNINRNNNINNIFKNNNINNNNNFNVNINNINKNNNKNIEKKDKKDEKDEKEKTEHEVVRPESALQIIIEIIRVFFISFIPALCDEFEVNNPIPVNNNNENNEENNENNENNMNNNNNNIFNNIDNNNINNNINNDFNINNENNQEDDSNNNKMTSSKIVNMSDDSSRDNRIYKLIKKDNQSANENEYVFSENGGIDSLSINSELYKQKREKEKEKEKDKGKEKEKEKQIFEEDEEYLIEDEKKKKNE